MQNHRSTVLGSSHKITMIPGNESKCPILPAIEDSACSTSFINRPPVLIAFDSRFFFTNEDGFYIGEAKREGPNRFVLDNSGYEERHKTVLGQFDTMAKEDRLLCYAYTSPNILRMHCSPLCTAIELSRSQEHEDFWNMIKIKYCK